MQVSEQIVDGEALSPVQHIRLHWLALSLALGGFAIGIAEFATMSLVPLIAHGLCVSVPDAGNAVSAYAAGVFVGAPLIAIFGAGYDRKRMLIGLMCLFALGNLLTGLVPDYRWLLIARFLAGLPHGAYFGFAAILIANASHPERRSQAIARVMLGLTVATIGGVPLAEIIGQLAGWRWAFFLVALLALGSAALIAVFAPGGDHARGSRIRNEIRVLRRAQLWITLGIGAIGFGGIFCVYTYLASVAQDVAHVEPGVQPLLFAMFGVGMTLGTLVFAWFADQRMMASIGIVLAINIAALASFSLACGTLYGLLGVVFLIGCGGGLAAVVQARLMHVARDGVALAQALNQSAFNAANTIGPIAGGAAINAGLGLGSVGWVGSLFAAGGFAMWLLALSTSRGERAQAAAQP